MIRLADLHPEVRDALRSRLVHKIRGEMPYDMYPMGGAFAGGGDELALTSSSASTFPVSLEDYEGGSLFHHSFVPRMNGMVGSRMIGLGMAGGKIGKMTRTGKVTKTDKDHITAAYPRIVLAYQHKGKRVPWKELKEHMLIGGEMSGGRGGIKKFFSHLGHEIHHGLDVAGNYAKQHILPEVKAGLQKAGKDITKYGVDKLKEGVTKYGKEAVDYLGKHAVDFITNPAVDAGLEDAAEVALVAAGLRRKRRGRKPKKTGRKKETKRGLIVGDIVRKTGMSLGDASHYVKEHGLY